MRCSIARSYSASAILLLLICSCVPATGAKPAPTPPADVKQLSSPDKETRKQSLENLKTQYYTTSHELLEVLQNAIGGHKDLDVYCSPLHCAIQAVDTWHVHRADDRLLSIVDYRLDVRSLPVGMDVSGDYFYPAASALVRLRVDAKKVADQIKVSQNRLQLHLLTWLLFQRTGTVNDAVIILENVRRNASAAEKDNLLEAVQLLDRDSGALPLPVDDEKAAKSPPAKTRSPAERGAERAKRDLTHGIWRILYYGKPWSARKPLRDDESGLPVKIDEGCDVPKEYVEETDAYNKVMREAAGKKGKEGR
jgi:hypothetical protein